MSKESKFAKLRLPGSKKNKTASSQISAFFANSTPSTSTNLNEDLKYFTHYDESSNESKNGTEYKLSSSLPERRRSESKSTDSRPLFASFEAVKPPKIPRIDPNKSTNRNSIKEFFTTTPANDNDFESPPAKAGKKTSTFKTKKRPNVLKRQPKIKNALLKREQIISNIIAEQSIADNVDPNEMQMALALSKSEMDTCKIEGDDEASNGSANSMEAIYNKLEEFGYRVGRVNGNHQFYGAPKVKAKWANKFTSLTLRHPERQQEKVNKKVEEFLNIQCIKQKALEPFSLRPLRMHSSFLSHMKAENCIHQRHRNYEFSTINDFYVANIFEPSHNKVGNLLKDFHAIPGRDRSPEKIKCHLENKLESREDDIKYVPEDKGQINQSISISACTKSTPTEEIPIASSSINSEDQKSYRAESPDLFMEEEDVPVLENAVNNSSCIVSVPNVVNQGLNVDIVPISSESSSNSILICENYSSDEVKTAADRGIWNQDLIYTLGKRNEDTTDEPEKIVDLTQEDSVDSMQSNLKSEPVCEEDPLPNSFRSATSNSTEINSSQDSTSSIIALSDDEVNYSIQVACELDLNDNSTDKSETDFLNQDRKSDAGTSGIVYNNNSSLNMLVKNNSPIKRSNLHPNKNAENILECNIISQTTQESGADKLNYSLAHEIMSRSFEEFEKIYNTDLHDKNEASSQGIAIEDLKQSKLLPVEQQNLPSTSKRTSYIRPETLDKLHDEVDISLRESLNSQSTSEAKFYPMDYNVITSPRYTEFIENISQTTHEYGANKLNYSLAHEIMSRSFEKFVKVYDTNLHDENEASSQGVNFENSTQSKPLPIEQQNEPSTSKRTSSIRPEIRDKLHDEVDISFREPLNSQSTSEEEFDLRDYNVITSPRYTEFIENHRNISLASQVTSPRTEEFPQPSTSEDSNYLSTKMSLNNTSINSCKKFKKTHSDSLLIANNKTPKSLKRFASNNKFENILKNDNHVDSLDEFDRLVYVDTHRNSKIKTNENITKLLTDVIIENRDDSIDEITYDGKKYLVRTNNVEPKPDYQRMDSPTRLKELNKFGLKPFKRKQAIVMLEYIYNQTHPLIVDDESDTNENKRNSQQSQKLHENDSEDLLIESENILCKSNKYGLKDCNGSLLVIENGHHHEVENEEFIFQTNIRSKVSTALLPLHLAWFNLVKSSEILREAILYYEPIDLQEIFTYFKSIGYRYDPKDLKRFFDGRSIIFQYDLSKVGSNRHIRKSQKQRRKKV